MYQLGGARLLTSRLARTLAPPEMQTDALPGRRQRQSRLRFEAFHHQPQQLALLEAARGLGELHDEQPLRRDEVELLLPRARRHDEVARALVGGVQPKREAVSGMRLGALEALDKELLRDELISLPRTVVQHKLAELGPLARSEQRAGGEVGMAVRVLAP